jgi:hypothetical protein
MTQEKCPVSLYEHSVKLWRHSVPVEVWFVETCTVCARQIEPTENSITIDYTNILGAEIRPLLGDYAASRRGVSLKTLILGVLYEVHKCCFTGIFGPIDLPSVTDCQPWVFMEFGKEAFTICLATATFMQIGCTEGHKWISKLAVHTVWQRKRPVWHFLSLQRKPSVAHTGDSPISANVRHKHVSFGDATEHRPSTVLLRLSASLRVTS